MHMAPARHHMLEQLLGLPSHKLLQHALYNAKCTTLIQCQDYILRNAYTLSK